tara:strand:- start:769 stop:1140 length:372 start_codon:yes stop_codon:yes gene_type:complete
MAIFYTSFKKRKRNRLPQTESLKKAISEQRKYLKSLGVDPDRRIDKSQFRAYGNWWEVNYNTDNSQQKQTVREKETVPNLGNGATKPARNWRLEESRNFTVAPAYNKGAYQVITKSNIKDIGK